MTAGAASVEQPPAGDPGDGEEGGRDSLLRRLIQGDLGELRVIVVLAVIWAIFQFQEDRFLSATNLTNLLLQITAIGLVSVGVVMVLLLGEIDLSVGAVSGLCASVMAVLSVRHGWSPYLAIAGAIAVGAAIGTFQGSVFTQFGIPSFVVTLAGLLGWQGAQLEVLGTTGTINLTDPTITGLTSTFYDGPVGWAVAIAGFAVYAAVSLAGWRRKEMVAAEAAPTGVGGRPRWTAGPRGRGSRRCPGRRAGGRWGCRPG